MINYISLEKGNEASRSSTVEESGFVGDIRRSKGKVYTRDFIGLYTGKAGQYKVYFSIGLLFFCLFFAKV